VRRMRGMDTGPHDRDELARRAKVLYERRIRERVEADGANEGRFVAVDATSGDYEVADDALSWTARGCAAGGPRPPSNLMRLGRPTAFRLGGRSLATRE
jgi:hypothetical protein